jgi:hypothetical protein
MLAFLVDEGVDPDIFLIYMLLAIRFAESDRETFPIVKFGFAKFNSLKYG